MKKVIVTTSWDDGHKLDFRLADLLKKYNLHGTFYISPKDREITEVDRLTNEEIISLSKYFEIGAHTLTHPRLSSISLEEANKEIVDSKKYLENILGKKMESFCYPGGDYNKLHEEVVKDAGFKLARSVRRFCFGLGDDNFCIPTTIHAYRHLSDVSNIYKHSKNLYKFIRNYFNWDELAMSLFDEVYQNGGVFHLWGHSWEIDKNKDWERLEKVFKYISNKTDIEYLENGKLI